MFLHVNDSLPSLPKVEELLGSTLGSTLWRTEKKQAVIVRLEQETTLAQYLLWLTEEQLGPR